jgi:hypothetical protein
MASAAAISKKRVAGAEADDFAVKKQRFEARQYYVVLTLDTVLMTI